ncbi:MAG: 16S rRNA (cytosine(967)-C(5))-methyltransferase RsmB [Oscillospiraceae bacterium]
MTHDHPRKLIVEGLIKVSNSGFSNLVFSSLIQDPKLSAQDKAFVAKVFYGTVERKITLNYILQKFISKPISKLDVEVLAILQSGLYQILYMNAVPAFAAINQAVGLCPIFKKTSAKGLVNAVLRKAIGFEIEKESFPDPKTELSVKYSVDKGILELLIRDYPKEYREILQSFFTAPPLTVNVNTYKISVAEYQALLEKEEVEYRNTEIENCLEIYHKGNIMSLPGFSEGFFFVQGITSQYALCAAGIKSGDSVLDLCAAPGGKTFAADIILKGSGSITACDPNPSRLSLIEDGGAKLGFGNIFTMENMGEVFNPSLCAQDVVLCDVPCSGIGIIPKKPDLRYKDLKDVGKLCLLQYEILTTASKYLKEKGRLVYSTCTLNRAENEDVVKKFLQENENFRLINQNCPIKGAVNDDNMVTFVPSKGNYDGFFIAVMEKVW